MKAKQNLHRSMVLILLILAMVALACQASSYLNGDDETDQPADGLSGDNESAEPVDLQAADLQAALAVEVVDERGELLNLLGRPGAFEISTMEINGGEVRFESWWYFQFGTRVDFVDGETVWTMDIEPPPEGSIIPAWYDPLVFEPGMHADSAAELAATASPAGARPETMDLSSGGEDLDGGALLVGDQILIGVHNDRVVYVETVPLFTEEGES